MGQNSFIFKLLNGQRGDFFEIPKKEFPEGLGELLFKDQSMAIVKVKDELFIKTTWLGRVKNSYFTVDGKRGTFKEGICGRILISDLRDSAPRRPIDEIVVLRQRTGGITVDKREDPINWLGQYHQKTYQASPVYSDPINLRTDWVVHLSVEFCEKFFKGVGKNQKIARRNAAEKAIAFLDEK